MTTFRLARGSILTPVVLRSETILLRKDIMEALLCTRCVHVGRRLRHLLLGPWSEPLATCVRPIDVSNHRGWDPRLDFWRSLHHHQVAPPRHDIDVDFDGRGTAGSKGVPIDESIDDDLPPLSESSDDDQD